MKERSHASFDAAAVISPELGYSTSCRGTPSRAAAALPSSTVTPRTWPLASRVAQKGDGDGPTPTATRRFPLGATSATGCADGRVAQAPSASAARTSTVFMGEPGRLKERFLDRQDT